jgi:hypothetical protein
MTMHLHSVLPIGSYLMADYSTLLPQPRDQSFNDAVMSICTNIFPDGFDVCDPAIAPNTWPDLFDHVQSTGRMVVGASSDPEDVFRDNNVYHAFRAWHDWMHLFSGAQFTLTGEAVAARCQEAQLAAMFGEAKAKAWMGYIHAEIITANFDGDTNAIDETVLRIA